MVPGVVILARSVAEGQNYTLGPILPSRAVQQPILVTSLYVSPYEFVVERW